MFVDKKIKPRPNVADYVFSLYCRMNFSRHSNHPLAYANSPSARTLAIYLVP